MWKLPDTHPDTINNLGQSIDQHGYACIPNALADEGLTALQAYVTALTLAHPDQYFAYHGAEKITNSLLQSLLHNETFIRCLTGLYEYCTRRPPGSTEVFPVLRCVQGNSGLKESNAFHFDASLVTVLVPIFIPQEGDQRGNLIMFPNLRGVRSNVLFNVIEKALLQNKLSRRAIVWAMRKGLLQPRQLPLVPGNLYLFWGYRSLHANEPCSPSVRRATALIHFGDPHANSRTTQLILKLNQRRARLACEPVHQDQPL